MNLSQYSDLAIRTCKPLPYDQHLQHMALGLAGETFELYDEREKWFEAESSEEVIALTESFKKELGDICWYAACLQYEFAENNTFKLFNIQEPVKFVRAQHTTVGIIVEKIKKRVIYGKQYSLEEMKSDLDILFENIIGFCATVGLDLSEVLEANIEKLKARYPNEYSNRAAIDRKDTN